jgi:hypothetical protein
MTLCRPWQPCTGEGLPSPPSLLTPSGYPLEFTFRLGSSDIVYTAEPGLPNAQTEDKWRLMQNLTDGAVSSSSHPLLQTLIAQPRQRFGCWLGVRHCGADRRFKAYQEVGPGAAPEILRHLRRFLPITGEAGGLIPTLLGIPASAYGETAEYYCVVNRPRPSLLHTLYAAAGTAKHFPSLLDYLAYLAAVPHGQVLQRLRIGLSFCAGDGKDPSPTFYAHACQLFGNDFLARQRWIGLARQLGEEAPVYAALTRGPRHTGPATLLHGMVGMKIGKTGRIECAIGLRPPYKRVRQSAEATPKTEDERYFSNASFLTR